MTIIKTIIILSSVFFPSVQDTVTAKDTHLTLHQSVYYPMGSVSFADSVVLYDPGAPGENTGDEPDLSFQKINRIIGSPDYNVKKDSSFVSLGKAGTIILHFKNNVLIDGPGPDLCIYEVNHDNEKVHVWISKDGIVFVPAGSASCENPLIDIGPFVKNGELYPYVKLRDIPGQGEETGPALGADIDAVGAVNTAQIFTVSSDSLFPDGRAAISMDANNILERIIETIKSIQYPVVILNAYSDNRGTDDLKLLLTYQQASNIKNMLIDEYLLNNAIFLVNGEGKNNPMASNDTETGRSQNRRIEFIVRLRSQ